MWSQSSRSHEFFVFCEELHRQESPAGHCFFKRRVIASNFCSLFGISTAAAFAAAADGSARIFSAVDTLGLQPLVTMSIHQFGGFQHLLAEISVLGKSRSSGSTSICWQHIRHSMVERRAWAGITRGTASVHLINTPRRSWSRTSGHRAALRKTRGVGSVRTPRIPSWRRPVSCRAFPWSGEPLLVSALFFSAPSQA